MRLRLLLLLLWLAPLALQAATWTVRPGEPIQPVLDRAAAGDVVELQRGQHRGNLRIAKPLTLRGVQRPTLSGGLQGDTIRVTAPDVRIEGLIVRDSGDSLLEQNAGIYLAPGAHRAVVTGFPGTFYGLLASERLQELSMEAPLPFSAQKLSSVIGW